VDDEERLKELSERLRMAHARVAALTVSAQEKSSTTRRLLVISEAAKHDAMRAAQRLDAFLAELDVRHPSG